MLKKHIRDNLQNNHVLDIKAILRRAPRTRQTLSSEGRDSYRLLLLVQVHDGGQFVVVVVVVVSLQAVGLAQPHASHVGQGARGFDEDVVGMQQAAPVSYTHLTLPTRFAV